MLRNMKAGTGPKRNREQRHFPSGEGDRQKIFSELITWKLKTNLEKTFNFNTMELSYRVKQKDNNMEIGDMTRFRKKLRISVKNLISDYRSYSQKKKKNLRKQREKNQKRMQEEFPKAE